MIMPYREHHLFSLLDEYDEQSLPLDLVIHHYFKSNKALGSKDRGFIAETAYALIRWKGLIDYLAPHKFLWEDKYALYQSEKFEAAKNKEDIPLHIRNSCPEELFNLFVASLGEAQTLQLCAVNNTQAPVTIRVNPLKTSREELLNRWRDLYDIKPCSQSAYGIIFNRRVNFYELPEFKQGFFEVQDEGSQLLADLMAVEPGHLVMDYCAGAGGKTLAFAHRMNNSGQIYLHDIRAHALTDAKKRMKRAGIQNAQIISDEESAKLNKLKKKMDWILVDAPCSGTGTMRRNPDMKWRFSREMLERLVGQQRNIFEKALSFLKQGGKIVYATCSVLKEENMDQINHFIKTYELELVTSPFASVPTLNGMDGFFGAVLQKTDRKS